MAGKVDLKDCVLVNETMQEMVMRGFFPWPCYDSFVCPLSRHHVVVVVVVDIVVALVVL
jgi:hypothetical protein